MGKLVENMWPLAQRLNDIPERLGHPFYKQVHLYCLEVPNLTLICEVQKVSKDLVRAYQDSAVELSLDDVVVSVTRDVSKVDLEGSSCEIEGCRYDLVAIGESDILFWKAIFRLKRRR
jgi:hypothetical protein